MVKQSAALNRSGAENMKPRQLSDAIHQEVGEEVKNQISDGVWEIIRSGDGMKSEIRDTVQSVYNKLLNPKGNENGESSTHNDAMPVQKGPDNNGSITATAGEIVESDSEPKEPPGFSLCDLRQNNNNEEEPKEELHLRIPLDGLPVVELKKEPQDSQDVLEHTAVDIREPPGFSAVMENKQPCDGNDEEPDVPPGFG